MSSAKNAVRRTSARQFPSHAGCTSVPATRVGGPKQFFFGLLGAYLLLAPASVSITADGTASTELKLLRIGTLGLAFLVGLQWFRFPRRSDASRALLFLAGGFAVAGVWSDSPARALVYKGLFVCSILAGTALANALRTTADLRGLCRMLSLSCLVGLILLAYIAATSSEPLVPDGRLRIAGLNPNLLAQSTSVFAILAGFHLLIGDVRRWQRIAVFCLVASTVVTVFSGSRAALLMLLVGGVVLVPLLRRPGSKRVLSSAFAAVCLALIGSIWLYTLDEGSLLGQTDSAFHNVALTRASSPAPDDELRIFDELTKNTRSGIWSYGLRQLYKSPVLGVGWLSHGSGWTTLQSAYLQIVVEAGVLGGGLLMWFMIAVAVRIREARIFIRNSRGLDSTLAVIFSAAVLALLFHGAFESSAVLGTTPNSLLLGFSVAQLDKLVRRGCAHH